MKLTIEFEPEWWRIVDGWRRFQCRITGHPGWRPPRLDDGITAAFSVWLGGPDNRLRCVRCNQPDPSEPKPAERGPYVHTFSGPDE